MKIFYTSVRVSPESENQAHGSVRNVNAHVFVRATDLDVASDLVRWVLDDQYWQIENNSLELTEVSEDMYADGREGLKSFREAEEKGYSTFYVGVPTENPTIEYPIGQGTRLSAPQGSFQRRSKRLSQTGRCLHFEAGSDCGPIIAAHSIQKSGILSKLSRNGMIYVLSSEIKDLVRSGGRLTLKTRGINRVSTFRGMCREHDNDTFEPIDNRPFGTNPVQTGLYAYRAMCRELFIKQNSVTQLTATLDETRHSKRRRSFLIDLLQGSRSGLAELHRHKKIFDDSLRNNNAHEFYFRAYRAHRPLPFAVSGIQYPSADFEGSYIQDTSLATQWDALTMSTVRDDTGGVLVFAWHASSTESVNKLFASLDRQVSGGASLDDLIGRYVVANVENVAYSPDWIEALSGQQRLELESFASRQVDMKQDLSRESLRSGIEGIFEPEFVLASERLS